MTQKYRNSALIKKNKKTCARIGSESAILRIFWIGSDLKKWYRCIPTKKVQFFLWCGKVGGCLEGGSMFQEVGVCMGFQRGAG